MLKYINPIVLLIISNVFMTFAWYGHLRHKNSALWIVILVSWGIAFLEYCFQVPANRMGHEVYNVVQLKTIQEVITLIIFSLFSALWYLLALALCSLSVFAKLCVPEKSSFAHIYR